MDNPEYRFKITKGEHEGKLCKLLSAAFAHEVDNEKGEKEAYMYRAVILEGGDAPVIVPNDGLTDAWTLKEYFDNALSGGDDTQRYGWLQKNQQGLELTLHVYQDKTFASNYDPWEEVNKREDQEVRMELTPLTTTAGLEFLLNAIGFKHYVKIDEEAPGARKSKPALKAVKGKSNA